MTVDLCAMHARLAADRPRLVREWVLQEGAERAASGLPPVVPRGGARPHPTPGAVMVLSAERA